MNNYVTWTELIYVVSGLTLLSYIAFKLGRGGERMRMLKSTDHGNIGIGETAPKHQVHIKCKCGNESGIDINFEINFVFVQFKCNECGKVMNVPECLIKEIKK